MATNSPVEQAVALAIAAAQNAYAPYSRYHVGAAIVAADGRIFTGCNIENASYPAGICAERAAIAQAVTQGVRDFTLVIVATQNGGSPCGICRQALLEFSPHARVLCVAFDGKVHIDSTVQGLIPHGFSPRNLR